MLKVFVDASAVLELILKRPRAEDIIRFFDQDSYQLCISPLTVHLAYYFGLKANVAPALISHALSEFEILTMDASTVRVAQKRLDGSDFEDCLQAATAEQANCELAITLDRKLSKSSGASLEVLVL
jgi:predicted nucleic acid-binding protein